MHWRSLRRSSGGGRGRLGRSSSYMRSLGSSVVEGALRSRLVKTGDGEYWVNVEAFTLQFRDESLCHMAASLLNSGQASMRVALDWLKQGLPFCPQFAITHITECGSRKPGNELLVAGPTAWGTELQLPGSWVEAIDAAQLPEEHPLTQPLEVPDGPAAFKVHLATPAGLAEATLLPEMLALLARQANPQHTGQLLAVPVRLGGPSVQAAALQQQEQAVGQSLQAPATRTLQQQRSGWRPMQEEQHHGWQQHGLAAAGGDAEGAGGAALARTQPEYGCREPCSQGLDGALPSLERLSRLGLGFPCDAEQQEPQQQGVDGLSSYVCCTGITDAVDNNSSSRDTVAPGILKISSANGSSSRGMSGTLPAATASAAAADASVLLASTQTAPTGT
ncbi:hypothetical protein COO60DRAFT_92785 [Scenedesmus sp. NREL 46B-D3]|nr:hypothetical protein COO60DRAFT_92785 [Scenedesmus sp. NREL 46B-D3]